MLEQIFTESFVKQVAGAVALVVIDLVFGVIVAIRTGQFDVNKLGNFYQTTVLPYLLGWLVLSLAIKVVGVLGLDDIVPFLPSSLETGAYLILLVAMGLQLKDKFMAIWGKVPGDRPV